MRHLIRFSYLLLSVQFSFCIWYCYSVGFNHQLTYIFDGDAARAIKLAQKATWFSDLGWYSYGPFYYRLSHQLANLFPNVFLYPVDSNSFLQSCVSTSLRMCSILLLFAFTMLLAKTLNIKKQLVPLFTVVLIASLFTNGTILQYAFRPYPDMSLAALLGISYSLALLSFLGKDSERHLGYTILSITFWAAAYQTKVSGLFYLPGLVILWTQTPILTRKNCLLAFYLLSITVALGYPQNIATIKVWLTAGTGGHAFNQNISIDTISYFLSNYWSQLSQPLLTSVIAGLVLLNKGEAGSFWRSGRYLLSLAAGLLIPLAFFLGFPLSSPTSHYPITLVFVTLILLVPLILIVSSAISNKLALLAASKHLPIFVTTIFPILLPLAFLSFGIRQGYLPLSLVKGRDKLDSCHQELLQFEKTFRQREGKIYATPYTPPILNLPKTVTVKSRWWHPTRVAFKEDTTGFIASTKFLARFLTENKKTQEYVKSTYKNDEGLIEEISSFAHTITNSEKFTDTYNREWTKVGSYTSCNFSFWAPRAPADSQTQEQSVSRPIDNKR